MKEWLNHIHQGHVLDVLSEMPSQFVDCIMFSPPYWGLRDYGAGTETVWDGQEECEHQWGEGTVRGGRIKRLEDKDPKQSKDGIAESFAKKEGGNTCVLCGAWKGQLGLEPHPQQYLDHMTLICHELKRVLKKTGSMYVNLGDTYHGGKRKYCPPQSINQSRTQFWNDTGVLPHRNLEDNGGWLQPKQKLLMPHRLAIQLQEDGWILRNDIVWHKPNAMPSSVKDRLTCQHEYVFHFVKSRKYFYDLDAIREPHSSPHPVSVNKRKTISMDSKVKATSELFIQKGSGGNLTKSLNQRVVNPNGKNPGDIFLKQDHVPSRNAGMYKGFNKRWKERQKGPKRNDESFSVAKGGQNKNFVGGGTHANLYDHPQGKNPGDFWSLSTKPFPEAHFAVYPVELCMKPIKSSCPDGGIVLDPFCGAGSTLVAAQKLGRKWIGIDISKEYCEMAKRRIERECAEKLTEYLGSD